MYLLKNFYKTINQNNKNISRYESQKINAEKRGFKEL